MICIWMIKKCQILQQKIKKYQPKPEINLEVNNKLNVFNVIFKDEN